MAGDSDTPLAVILGGPSAEHDVSIETGIEMLAALGARGRRVRAVLVTRDGKWIPGEEGDVDTLFGGPDVPVEWVLEQIAARGEIAVLALHGRFGEDGAVQRLLSERGVRFTGSGARASAIAMDKVASKARARALGAQLAPHHVVSSGEPVPHPDALEPPLGFPCVVKPVHSGSSVALTFVREPEDLSRAVELACAEDAAGQAMIERAIDGLEVTCTVLRRAGDVVALPLLSIEPRGGLYDYHAKYVAEDTTIREAAIDTATANEIREISVALYRDLGLRGFARVDFIVERATSTPRFLELNTLPGFTAHSLVPRAAELAGIERGELLEWLVADASAGR